MRVLVARALDFAKPPPLFTGMDTIYNALDLLNFGDPAPLQSALVQLDGEVYADVPSVEIEAHRMFVGLLHDRMRTKPGGTAGGNLLGEGLGSNGFRQWVSAFGGAGGLSGSGDTHNLSFDSAGVAAGIERGFDPATLAGIALGYTRANLSTHGISGEGDFDALSFAFYGTYQPGPWYASGAVGYGHDDGSAVRSIVFPGVLRAASGGVGANDFLSSVEAGFHMRIDDVTVATPFAGFEGILIGQSSATESGAGALDLHLRSDSIFSARTIIGAELARDVTILPAGPLRVAGRVGWGHELAGTARTATAHFDGAPDAVFTVNGAAVPRDAAIVGVTVTLATTGADIFLRYDGMVANGASTHAGVAELRFAF